MKNQLALKAALAAIILAFCIAGLVLGISARQSTIEEKALYFEKAGLCQGITTSATMENIDKAVGEIPSIVTGYAVSQKKAEYCSYLMEDRQKEACAEAVGAG